MPAGLGEADVNLNTRADDDDLTVNVLGHLGGHLDESLLVQLGLKVPHKVVEDVHAERLRAVVVEKVAELERQLVP